MKKNKTYQIIFYSLVFLLVFYNAGFAQWQWVWPLPQGVSLNSVSFLNESTGIFAGERGVILKTTNAGMNYSLINIGFQLNLGACIYLNEDVCFAGGGSSRIYKSINSGSNWTYTSIESNYGINKFSFVNDHTGWASAYYKEIYKTTNSGLTWTHQTLPNLTVVNSIYFLNSLTGFAGGDAVRTKLIKTTDGGNTWIRSNYENQQTINSIFFKDSLTGFLGCSNSKIYRTTDGGNNWISNKNSFLYGNFKSIKFVNDTGFAIMDYGDLQLIYKSADKGLNWDEVYYDTLVKITSLDIAAQNVVVTGTSGRIIKSDDLGVNWTSNKENILNGFSYIKFINENTGIAVGRGFPNTSYRTYITTNGGQNWIIQSNATNVHSVSKIYFVDMNTGYIVGGNSNIYGKVYKTINSGKSWTELPPPLNKDMYDVEFINSLTGIVCGLEGLIAKTTNGALSWSVTNSGGPHLNSDLDFIDSVNCVSGSSGGDILKSTNGGNTWIVSSNIGQYSIGDISFLNGLTGFVATSNGVFKTVNGGFNWQIISTGGTFHSLEFFDINTGFVSSYNGRIYRTTDGGNSWTDQSYINSGLDYHLYNFVSADIVYMLGNNMLFKTTNGGVLTNLITNSNNINKNFILSQNYPNPFNPDTKIEYQIPFDQFVKITVYDLSGKQIQELLNKFIKAGSYEIQFNAGNLPSGIYFYKIESTEYSESKKMILLK